MGLWPPQLQLLPNTPKPIHFLVKALRWLVFQHLVTSANEMSFCTSLCPHKDVTRDLIPGCVCCVGRAAPRLGCLPMRKALWAHTHPTSRNPQLKHFHKLPLCLSFPGMTAWGGVALTLRTLT